ncbi:hypothetical protein AB5J72_39235 [Streptomyces sp. CG1]|uniref:hypothetical protein n=1 Tax=Streptomyces sp. CG1 TaxID=1287523 RepID=UPI0034E252CA
MRKTLSGLPLTITTHLSGYQLTGAPEAVECQVFDALVHSAEAGSAHITSPPRRGSGPLSTCGTAPPSAG